MIVQEINATQLKSWSEAFKCTVCNFSQWKQWNKRRRLMRWSSFRPSEFIVKQPVIVTWLRQKSLMYWCWISSWYRWICTVQPVNQCQGGNDGLWTSKHFWVFPDQIFQVGASTHTLFVSIPDPYLTQVFHLPLSYWLFASPRSASTPFC